MSETTTTIPEPLPVGSDDYSRAAIFLYREAQLLDGAQFDPWLETLHDELVYEMPVRQSVMPKDGPGFVDGMTFLTETRNSLLTRVRRLQTEQAWAEQPGSRTRHLVANVLVERGEAPEELNVASAFVVTRTRADLPYDLFTGERRDVLVREQGRLLLKRRQILFDQTVMKSYNLSIFL
ncbi:MAG TPA: 3-phenylpropionate/cinnamic acid dioxygenase subunit beta [Conexibacter sp.]|nr:3-phenylpropionate/cinnamic acid dioxygenase subunit beta [Conexibacter sp.]